MLSHAFVGITDFSRAFAFYAPIMEALGFPLRFSDPGKPWAAWKPANAARPIFVIGHPVNGEAATPGNGQMVALLAPTRGAVDRSYALAMALKFSRKGITGARSTGGLGEGPSLKYSSWRTNGRRKIDRRTRRTHRPRAANFAPTI